MRIAALSFVIALVAVASAAAEEADGVPSPALMGGPAEAEPPRDVAVASPMAESGERPALLTRVPSHPGERVTLSRDFLATGLTGGVGAGICRFTNRDRVVVLRSRRSAHDRGSLRRARGF